MANTDLENICARFNGIRWHDSKLIDLQISEDGPSHTARFKIRLLTSSQPGSYGLEDSTLVLTDCRLVKADLDLLGKQLCGGDVAVAFCEAESELKTLMESQLLKEFDLPQEESPLADYLQFAIRLISPAGEVIVFAKDFQLIK